MNMTSQFSASDELTLAIDFGTSNSLVAAASRQAVSEPLPLDPDAADPTVVRSVLFFPSQDLCYYGQKAIEEYADQHGSGRLVRSVKKYLPSESFKGSWIENRLLRLEDMIGIFLLELRKRASQNLDRDVESVLLGRPAKFSDDPVKDKLAEYRLQKAAEFAGFKQISFLPEPLAAAFDLRRKLTETKTVLVVDLGGGTSDFTVIRIGPEAFQESDVLAIGGVSVAGDVVDGEFMRHRIAPFLGSKVRYRVPMGSNVLEMPKSLLDHICSPADMAQLEKSDYMHFFRSVRNWSLRDVDRESLDRLITIVEDQRGFQLFESIDNAKRGFSTSDTVRFEFDYPDAEIDFEVTRPDFGVLIHGAAEKIMASLDETLKNSQLGPDDIDIVYCTGGTSKLHAIQSSLRQRFKPERIVGNNYFHSVIAGLANRAQEMAATQS